MGATRVLTVASAKGGVGKTLIATHLAAQYALAGKKTLLCDVEPQRNAAELLLAHTDVDPYGVGVGEVVMGQASLTDAVVASRIPYLDVVRPGVMEDAESWMASKRASETLLTRALIDPIVDAQAYDVIVVDTPPALMQSTLGAMVATAGRGGVVIPAKVTDSNSLGGVRDVIDAIEDLSVFGAIRPLGVVLTETSSKGTVTMREMSAVVKKLRAPVVGEWTLSEAFRTATTAGRVLQEWRPSSPVNGEIEETARVLWRKAGK